MKSGPLQLTGRFFIASLIVIIAAVLFTVTSVKYTPETAAQQFVNQATTGTLTVTNNSLPQDYTSSVLTVRTQMYICLASGAPLTGSSVLLPGQTFSAQVSTDVTSPYQIRTYNEVVGLGQSAAATFMSADPYYYQLVCQDIVPNSIVATVNSISSDYVTQVTVSGTTQATLTGGAVPGLEIPVYKAIPPTGSISTGVRITTVDLRNINAGQLASSTTPLTTACINDQFTVTQNPANGDYQLVAGIYVIKIPTEFSGPEVFDCQDPTAAPVTVATNSIISVLYALVDNQNGFSGITTLQQRLPVTQTPPANPTPNPAPVPAPVSNQVTPQAAPAYTFANGDATSQQDLIRSGGSSPQYGNSALIVLIVIGLIGTADSLRTLSPHVDE